MCGIVGVAARRDVVPTLIHGLKALEYRGYDSAGIALLTANGMERLRAKGKVGELESLYAASPIGGQTMWARPAATLESISTPMARPSAIATQRARFGVTPLTHTPRRRAQPRAMQARTAAPAQEATGPPGKGSAWPATIAAATAEKITS